MAIKVKYLAEDEIEKDAELLLAEYEDPTGEPITLPVPVSDITTYHLALRLGFDDLHKTLNRPMLCGQPDILGAIWVEKELVLFWVEKELVLIDRHLDPMDLRAVGRRKVFVFRDRPTAPRRRAGTGKPASAECAEQPL